MKLILSRKGFDSSSGGCPSPIFPDGSLHALPIPDKNSKIKYSDLSVNGEKTSALIRQLRNRTHLETNNTHLDPDINPEDLPRQPGWRPVLGQTGAAQGHLNNQNVGVGDLFVFFGLFREVIKLNRKWQFDKNSSPKQVVWGWLQVGDVIKVDELKASDLPWVRYHPHLQTRPDKNNTLYLASDRLNLSSDKELPGAGVFTSLQSKLVLTNISQALPSQWLLPRWFHPSKAKETLSYHGREDRWSLDKTGCHLKAVARGQEFVLSNANKEKVSNWLFD